MATSAAAPGIFANRKGSGRLLDAVIAAVAFIATLVLLQHGGLPLGPVDAGHLDVVGVLLAACSTLPLIFWRRSPFGVFVLTAAAGVPLAHLIDLEIGPAVALHLLAASRNRRSPGPVFVAIAVVGLFAAYLGVAAVVQREFPTPQLLHTGLAWAVAWFSGERTRLRREQLADFRERALRAEADAERDRLLAVAEERARIARDLHDSAGHAISVIAVRAGAARLRHAQEPERTLAALAAVEELARQTAEEIDHIVGTLREGDPTYEGVETPPGLASLDTLVTRQTAAGNKITLDTTGEPRPLGMAADQAAYRILQETLTNAAEHGTGGARIGLNFADTAVEITVTNSVDAGKNPRSGGGHGLIGMRERATLLGGSLDARRTGDVFRVRARIPYEGDHT